MDECPVCLRNVPLRITPCIHHFCIDCLQTLANNSDSGRDFPCPVCRRSIDIPAEGVSAFPHKISTPSIPSRFLNRPDSQRSSSIHNTAQQTRQTVTPSPPLQELDIQLEIDEDLAVLLQQEELLDSCRREARARRTTSRSNVPREKILIARPRQLSPPPVRGCRSDDSHQPIPRLFGPVKANIMYSQPYPQPTFASYAPYQPPVNPSKMAPYVISQPAPFPAQSFLPPISWTNSVCQPNNYQLVPQANNFCQPFAQPTFPQMGGVNFGPPACQSCMVQHTVVHHQVSTTSSWTSYAQGPGFY